MSDESPRLWINAVNASMKRQTSIMRSASLVWGALLGALLLAHSALITIWWTVDGTPLAQRFDVSGGCYAVACTRWFDGPSTTALLWILAAIIPCLLVPPRSPLTTAKIVRSANPYRSSASLGVPGPDVFLWLQQRRTRRALVASASAGCLVVLAGFDLVASFQVAYHSLSRVAPAPQVSDVAAVDLAVAGMTMLVYVLAARSRPRPVGNGHIEESLLPLREHAP